MVNLTEITNIAVIVEALATTALVFLLFYTVRQMEHTVALHRIQAEYHLRPWLGPQSSIKLLNQNADGRYQFDISIKNYGELPSMNTMVSYKMKNKLITRQETKQDTTHTFNLGPMLPNMEKHYWFFIDSGLIQKSKEGKENLFISLYFEYKFGETVSGYGMISQFEPNSNEFIHKDMWVDTPGVLNKT
ncbi:MAG: hypothetical protein E6K91_07195 [Thaumarchaeota archaeon]|nr:MAG: hypothetical protein E6K91_07195 [Nitrososphaerota archaeon]